MHDVAKWVGQNWPDLVASLLAGAALVVATLAWRATRDQADSTKDGAEAAARSADAAELSVAAAEGAAAEAKRSADEAEKAGHEARKPRITVRTETGEWGYPFVVHLTTTCHLYKLQIHLRRGSEDPAQADWTAGMYSYRHSRINGIDNWTGVANVDHPGQDNRGRITAGSTFSLMIRPTYGSDHYAKFGRAVFVCRAETEDGEVWDDIHLDTGVIPIVWKLHP